MSENSIYFQVKNLSKRYTGNQILFKHGTDDKFVVNNISFNVYRAQRLALIGETGSGKTTLGKCLIRLTPANAGTVVHNNVDILSLRDRQYKEYRKKFQMIFQNPSQSLNPVQNTLSTLSEPLKIVVGLKGYTLNKRIEELLSLVQLDESLLKHYPHELSGGQKQRIAIARALTVNPTCIIADEPTSALDAALKLAIANLLNSLWEKLGLTLILISHDLSMVSHISDRIAVMYRGILVEIAETKQLFEAPLHPYSKQLVDPALELIDYNPEINGRESGQGCAFAGRCDKVQSKCYEDPPSLNMVNEHHSVACHFAQI